jgi:hypothetical protein
VNAVLQSLGGVALFLVAGLGLAELVPSVRTLPWPRRLAWAYLLGLAGAGSALYALSHFLDAPLRRPAILGTVAALALIGIFRRILRRGSPRHLPRRPRRRGLSGRFQTAAAALLAFICLGLLADAVSDPVTGWDARMHWAAQASWIRDEGTVDSEVLQRKNLYVNHPRYPLLMPIAQAAVQETFAMPQDVHAFRAVYTTFFAAFLLLLYDGARRWAGRLPALLAGLAAAGVPVLTFFEDSGAASAYSDFPLAVFYGAGLLLLLRGRQSLADGLGAGLLLAGAALSKNEGMVLAFFALGAASLVFLGRRGRPGQRLRHIFRIAAAAMLIVLALALLTSWRADIPNRQDERYEILLQERAIWPSVVTRIPLIATGAAAQMFRFDHWTLFWIVVPVVLWTGRRGWRGRRRGLALAMAVGAVAPLAIAWGAYSIHPGPESLIPVTWSRFLVQGSVPLFLLLALALRDLLRRSPFGARLA